MPDLDARRRAVAFLRSWNITLDTAAVGGIPPEEVQNVELIADGVRLFPERYRSVFLDNPTNAMRIALQAPGWPACGQLASDGRVLALSMYCDLYTVMHEFGHYIDYLGLRNSAAKTLELRHFAVARDERFAQRVTGSGQPTGQRRPGFISNYAASNEAEDFAETWAIWILHRADYERIAAQDEAAGNRQLRHKAELIQWLASDVYPGWDYAVVGRNRPEVTYYPGFNRVDIWTRRPGDGALIQSYGDWRSALIHADQGAGLILTSRPAVRYVAFGEWHIFVRGLDGAVHTRSFQNGGWTPWINLGGYITSPPVVTVGPGSRIDIWARGAEGHLWQLRRVNNQWAPSWIDRGGWLSSEPAAIYRDVHRWDIFVRGQDWGLYHCSFDGTTIDAPQPGEWLPLGGYLSSNPVVSTTGADRIDVWARGADGGLWQVYFDAASWREWRGHGGFFYGDPAVTTTGTDRWDVWVRGGNDALGHWWFLNAPAWEDLGGGLTSDPTVRYDPINHQWHIWVRGLTGRIVHRWYEGGWSDWPDIGLPASWT